MTRKVLISVGATTVVVVAVLLLLEAYYVTIALAAGVLVLAHREVWSLLRRRRLPVLDERVRQNIGRSVRNGFVFLMVSLALLVLPFSTRVTSLPDTQDLLAGLFLAGGVAYLVSYLYFDRAGPNLSQRRGDMLKVFLIVAAGGVAAFVICATLHNAVSALFDVEEPVFFTIAVIIAPLAVAVGLIGSLVVFLTGLFQRTP